MASLLIEKMASTFPKLWTEKFQVDGEIVKTWSIRSDGGPLGPSPEGPSDLCEKSELMGKRVKYSSVKKLSDGLQRC